MPELALNDPKRMFDLGADAGLDVSYLILAAQQHDALHTYSAVMLGFVIPLTVVTLVVSLIRPSRGVQ